MPERNPGNRLSPSPGRTGTPQDEDFRSQYRSMVGAPLRLPCRLAFNPEKAMRYNTKSMSDLHHERWLAPAALACCILLCRRCAKRIFDTTKYIVRAASPRE